MSEALGIAIVSTLGGIAIAYITNVVAKKVQDKKATKQPKDRMESMFDGYERLIKQKDLEDDRKARLIESLEQEIGVVKEELRESRAENRELKELLQNMRAQYEREKKSDLVK